MLLETIEQVYWKVQDKLSPHSELEEHSVETMSCQ
jgi:hypothetical protein